jgi:hypothetical protein
MSRDDGRWHRSTNEPGTNTRTVVNENGNKAHVHLDGSVVDRKGNTSFLGTTTADILGRVTTAQYDIDGGSRGFNGD